MMNLFSDRLTNRRDFLKVGALTGLGLSLPTLLASKARAGAARPDVDQRQLVAMRGERLDPRLAQMDPAQPAVDPAQVAQIGGQRDRVVEGTVEQLDGVGLAVHVRAGYDALVP